MSMNGLTVRAVVNELKSDIAGARVDKIYQENKDIILHIRNNNKNSILYFSFGADNPSFYLTDKKLDNPKEPPMFCMLLRKYLTGARLENIEQHGLDRIVEMRFKTSGELFDMPYVNLIFEMMGKYSNLILVNSNTGEILDSLIRVYPDMSSVRLVLPHEMYKLPTESLISPLRSDVDDITRLLENNNVAALDKLLYKNIEGFSPDVSRELLFRCGLGFDSSYSSLSSDDKERLLNSIMSLFNTINRSNFEFCTYSINGKQKIISAIKLTHVSADKTSYNTMNEACRAFYESKAYKKIYDSRITELTKKLKTRIDSLTKTLSIQLNDYERSKDREQIKIYADLLSANIYKIERGASSLVVNNFYSEECEATEIKLDKKLSPKLNVERYYNRYNKLKHQEEILKERIPKTENEIYYLRSVIVNLEQAETLDDINDIKDELQELGFITSYKKKKAARPKISYKEFETPNGIKVFAGKNNIQNDKLTFKIAHKNDLWFHIKNEPGSHVILLSHDKDVTDEDILYAASVAARLSGKTVKCNIDYTEVKNVKKIKGANPGLVNYYEYKTVTVTP